MKYFFYVRAKSANGVWSDVGVSAGTLVQAPHYETKMYGDMPLLDVSASHNPAAGNSSIFLVNRSQREPLATELVWQSEAPRRIKAMYQLAGSDPKAANTFEQPDALTPRALAGCPLDDHTATLMLPPLSFTVVTLEV